MGTKKEKQHGNKRKGEKINKQPPKSPNEGSSPPKKRKDDVAKTGHPIRMKGKKIVSEVQLPRLDPKSVGYFRRVGETLQEKFESDEDRGIFIRNVFHEVKGNEVALATDMSGSLVLQKLFSVATSSQLCRVLTVLSTQWQEVCWHHSGAHVIQTALLQFQRLQKEPEEEEEMEEGEEPVRTLEEIVLNLCSEIKEKFILYNQDTHGSFVVRTLFQVLSGVILTKEMGRKGAKGPAVSSEFEVPDSFLAQLQELCSCFNEHVGVFATQKVASMGMQVALQVLHRKAPAVCAKLCQQMIEYLSSRNTSADGSSLLGVSLKIDQQPLTGEDLRCQGQVSQLRRVFKNHIPSQLHTFSAHPIANYTVQRLHWRHPDKENCSTVFR
ncbi:hypothetical protein GDO86_016601 [Hymenochirus boettgeri]|uniref:Nucleolar protein 9 n=1 Tax=Hymenochirus boettgeri TaxID=247094 RepID=A0A8T2K3M1_9PIPI|nr:hypothetical protein GDO86_016601 [Hymenochirus boettgeri]